MSTGGGYRVDRPLAEICISPLSYEIKVSPNQWRLHMSAIISKEDAHKLIDQLPPNATWEDLMHEIYVREAIERGLEDSKAGRTRGVAEIRKKYGLPE